jgi:enolase-phosphatase E1
VIVAGITAVLLDIEGTTTPIAFVHDRLFPFARARAGDFLRKHWDTARVRDVVETLAEEQAADVQAGAQPPPWGPAPEPVEAYVRWLMDRDRKSPGLKELQGWIWEGGYLDGLLKSEVFADTPRAIRRWRDAGLDVAIYSSGSALAQRLLFGHTAQGDLTPLLSGFFDTSVGSKRSADSYSRIAQQLGRAPGAILFISDVTAELRAAKAAGMQALLSVRPGNPPQEDASDFESVSSFDDVGV